MKFSKKSKVMAAAIAMLTLSTAGAVTGTVAWFTSSNVVTASGMSIQAEAEQGILIANESFATWKDSVEASHKGANKTFIPTSTADTVTSLFGFPLRVTSFTVTFVIVNVLPSYSFSYSNPDFFHVSNLP